MTQDSYGKKKSSETKTDDVTRIDLGDDLVENTRVTTYLETPSEKSEAVFDIDDQLQSAQILLGEELFEEAKKILRKILILDPRRIDARQVLNQIHEKELKQLFGEGSRRKFLGLDSAGDASADFLSMATDDVIRELDRDLKLGIFASDGTTNSVVSGEAQGFPLFSDPKAIKEYGDRLEADFGKLSGQDRIDLGIAFFEMGLYEIAIRQFKAAYQFYTQAEPEILSKGALVASSLLAYTFILAGKAYEAAQLVQSMIRDVSITPENKLEFVYLMGRAYEAMGREELSVHWYSQAYRQDPSYRDIALRLQNLAKRKAKGVLGK